MASLKPTFGVSGLPTGVKEQGKRVDFKPNDFSLLIETKGYRICWTRAATCPCAPINTQTEQPDPNCELCHGHGWIYFGNGEPLDTEVSGDLDAIQKAIVAENGGGMVIRGIMSRFEGEDTRYDELGKWKWGTAQLTVRPENKLGYYDRIVNLDSEIVYSEVIENPGNTLTARYPMTGINLIRSMAKEYVIGEDFDLETGELVWRPGKGPSTGERLALHYLCHPAWIIMEYPHMLRTTTLKYKNPRPTTPRGDPTPLPVQAKVMYEFLL